MTKQFLLFLLLACLLISCEKTNFNYTQDGNYPTVINKLSSTALAALKTDYIQKNQYLQSSLNQFGFCDLVEINNSIVSPPPLNLQTQAEATEIVKNFVSQNSIYTGVKNPDNLSLSEIFLSTPYWDAATCWVLKSSNQFIDTIEVINSQIIFQLKSHEVVYCAGNWYPNVYIPGKFNITRENAKSSLLNKIVWHSTIAGVPYSEQVAAESLAASTVRLVVFPVTTDNKIELRVTWQINIPNPVYYIIRVDVMTGEIISQEPTIIS
jgi:hypothetical protein